MNNDVFISYSHYDKKIADALCHYLEQSNIKCWIAPRDINSGEEYGEAIEKAICKTKIFLLLYSKDSSVSPWVKGELNIAFSEEKYIAPIRIDNTSIEGSNRLILNQMHWIDIFPFVESNFQVVKDSIQTLLVNTDYKEEEPLILNNRWNHKEYLWGSKLRLFVMFALFTILLFLGEYLICFLCSVAAQIGIWIEPLNLDTENMNLPDTATILWLPTFIIILLVFIAQGIKRKSTSKIIASLACIILCVQCLRVGTNSIWFYGHRYSEGFWIFEKNGDFMSDNSKYGARNMFGVIEIPAIYEEMGRFDEGYSIVKKGGYWGAIDKSQKTIVPFKYTNYSHVENFLYGIQTDED